MGGHRESVEIRHGRSLEFTAACFKNRHSVNKRSSMGKAFEIRDTRFHGAIVGFRTRRSASS